MDVRDVLFAVQKLKKVKRQGWVYAGIKDAESVADHSYGVAVLAMLFAKELECDENKLMKMALVHDLAESIVGDIMTPHLTKEEVLKEKFLAEKKAIESIFGKDKGGKEYVNLWIEFEEQKTHEAKILKQLERLEKFFQAFEYEHQGHLKEKLGEFWETAEKQVYDKKLRPVLLDLMKLRKK